MGFKCRLFGHSYGPPEAERSREEDGDEVVVTVRNVKRCERCGDERTVNQTKEVTSVRTPDEVGLDAEATGSPASAAGTTGTGTGTGAAPGESPVTPVEPDAPPAAGTSDPVDATVGADADPDPDPASAAEAAADVDGDVDGGVTTPADDGSAPPQSADADPVEDATVEDPTASTVDADAGSESAERGSDDGWTTGSDDWDDVDPDPDVDDAVILDDADGERDEVQWPEDSDAAPGAGDATDSDAPSGPDVEADEAPKNDAEIIDGEAPAPDSEGAGGEWPDHEGGWPDHDGTDEGYSAAPNADVDAEFAGNGLTPEVNGGAPDDPDAVDGIAVGGDGGAVERTFADADGGADADADTDEGFVSAGDSTAGDVPADRVEFYCPNCGHAQVAGTSSIRAGDICPECKKGYIAERER